MRRLFFSFPESVPTYAAVIAVIFIFFGVVVEPHVSSPSVIEMLSVIGLLYLVAVLLLLIGSLVFLIRRKWLSATLLLSAAFILSAALTVEDTIVLYNEYGFTGPAHAEIAEIFNRNSSEFDLATTVPRLIDLDQRCHPPGGEGGGCGCWLLLDPAHTSGADNEKAGWHRPVASIFHQKALPIQLVSVRPIDAGSYSVLGCDEDWRTWLQRIR